MPQKRRNTTQHELSVIQANTCEGAMKILNISRATVHNICTDNGITFVRLRALPITGKYGNKIPMRDDYAAGMTIAALAKKYNEEACRVRSHVQQQYYGPVFKYLSAAEIDWLDHGRPRGMTVYEYAAVLIRDAYLEETE